MPPEDYAKRRLVGRQALDDLFGRIGDRLTRMVRAWDIGGSPMVYRNLKQGTKDADLVVDTVRDQDDLVQVLLTPEFSYEVFGGLPGYKEMDAVLLRRDGALGVDVFVHQIMQKFVLSDSMKRRAEGPHRFGHLELFHCSNEDLFLFKSITHRPDDDTDILRLATVGLDEKALYEEVRVQQKLSGENWPWLIFHALSALEERTGTNLAIKSAIMD